jgi:hypothetical protein
MNFLLVFILLSVVYLLAITYIHHCIMRACNKVAAMPDNKRVLGIITDNRPNNLINRDLK